MWRLVTNITGFNLGLLQVATPAMDAVLLVLGTLPVAEVEGAVLCSTSFCLLLEISKIGRPVARFRK